MKVAFDARMIEHPGIGRYIRNLLSAMLNIAVDFEFNLYGAPDKLADFRTAKINKYSACVYSIRELFFSSFPKNRFNLTHIPHFNAPFKDIDNLVITIHDLIYVNFPYETTYIKCVLAKLMIANAIKKAKKIIAISEATKKDIIDIFPDTEGKIKVIYEAADPIFKKIKDPAALRGIKQKYNLPDEFILFVGTLKKHKNISRLIDAYEGIKYEGLKHKLVIIGKCDRSEKEIIHKIRSEGVIYLGTIPADDLVAIYNLATLLVLPSLYEGFGLPVLEAMASGVPVACSRASSLPEVGAEAAIYFDPRATENITDILCRVLMDHRLRESMIIKGFENIKRFSWEKTAQETLQVYKEVFPK